MSFASEMIPIGERVFRNCFGLFLWRGVSTWPGATALKRMLFFAYSIARLRVIASSPPLVIIGIDAGKPAMGFSTSDVVMLVSCARLRRRYSRDPEMPGQRLLRCPVRRRLR